MDNNLYDVLIIGSGPAGNTAGIYCARSGFKTALLTGNSVGGQLTITTDVENFPAFPDPINGSELVNRMIKQSENVGVEVIYDAVVKVDLSQKPFTCLLDSGKTYKAKNIIIATGAVSKWLGLESEQFFLGYGVSGCATCDGNFFRNKPVAVVGGGDSAGTEAIHMSHIASKVYLIYRKNELARMQESISKQIINNSKIELVLNSTIDEICGSTDPKSVTHIRVLNNKTGNVSELTVDAVFIAIGRKPTSDLFIDSGLNIDKNGYIVTEADSSRTNIRNVYAVGDVTNKKYKQAIVAAGYGAIAALEVEDDNK